MGCNDNLCPKYNHRCSALGAMPSENESMWMSRGGVVLTLRCSLLDQFLGLSRRLPLAVPWAGSGPVDSVANAHVARMSLPLMRSYRRSACAANTGS
jgi:hypothetical protein